MVLRKSFYIRWSAGRSPRVHEVNPGRDPSEGASFSRAGKRVSLTYFRPTHSSHGQS